MSTYRAVVLGATGAVGSALVRELLASEDCDTVAIVVRRPTGLFEADPQAPKLIQHVFPLDSLEREAAQLAVGCRAAFCTLGVGQPRKVSPEEHRRVDVGFAAAFARGCRQAGVRHYSLLTSAGADLGARSRFLRIKAEAEREVCGAGFGRTSLFRPSLLATRQARYGLHDRIAQSMFPRVSGILPQRYHEVRVKDLGRAMRLNAERPATGAIEVLHYPEFMRLLGEPGQEVRG